MAKRTQSTTPRTRRAKANDTATAPREQQQRSEELPNIPEPGDAADMAQRTESRFYESITVAPDSFEARSADAVTSESAVSEPESTHSTSMSSEPSEADIRMRAYQRYLERGGRHGGHVDDWFAAERDLKSKVESR